MAFSPQFPAIAKSRTNDIINKMKLAKVKKKKVAKSKTLFGKSLFSYYYPYKLIPLKINDQLNEEFMINKPKTNL